jgi:prepilin-type N-terminal cleavage/methylation domain-containing protein
VNQSTRGFTLAEVLVAILILSVGLLAIAASSGTVYRLLGYGKRSTEAASLAASRLEWLRREANLTSPRCTGLVGGTDTVPGGVIEQWTVTGSGASRSVVLVVTTPTGRGTTDDSIFTLLDCR